MRESFPFVLLGALIGSIGVVVVLIVSGHPAMVVAASIDSSGYAPWVIVIVATNLILLGGYVAYGFPFFISIFGKWDSNAKIGMPSTQTIMLMSTIAAMIAAFASAFSGYYTRQSAIQSQASEEY